ncbi:Mob1/phocein [Cutaneotrichosporon oleaginosum]|uniref:Mob1/phocein n=1 Tax=Cutaneotrichosporon oleaginosum TaxID=879819 RepID=A0A0J0XW81_9TREE|nr:Mob1/phocein [Cutaneotrichosporon oleaginosum]KLT45303.1 Mob1/phocein [Cutaneotrichosporon oleaginosum]TXT14868.1 hypothetical protein COLE_01061 [Cutaneotrichosporon oleaginosum]
MDVPAEQDYRFKRGTKLADFAPVQPDATVPPLSSFDGPFQLAEYLSLKVRADPHDIRGLVDVPSDNAKAADKHVWIYEHLRRIPIDATPLITQLLQLCSRDTCPEMKAAEWQYLCVAHGGDSTDTCCAIDYILHTVDSTTALLNSSNYFPSRLQIPHASLAHFPSLFRRLSRIFSHAYFHHGEAFATAEAETSLYARFVALCEKYELVSSTLLIIPQSGYEVTVMDDDGWGDDDEDKAEDEEEEGEKVDEEQAKEEDKDNDHEEKPTEEPTSPRPEDKTDEERRTDASSPPADSALRPSLGRYASPGKWATSPVQPATKGKPAPAHTSESLSPPSTRATLDNFEDEKPLPKASTNKRGTLSRGKAPRAANVWAAEKEAEGEEVPPLPTSPGIGMARKESVESVVYVGKDGEDEDVHSETTSDAITDAAVTSSPASAPSVLEPAAPEEAASPAPSETLAVEETEQSTSPKTPALSIPTPPPTSTLGTSPRSELQARPDNGREQLAVSPRGTTGRRGQRKNRVPRSPGKKGQGQGQTQGQGQQRDEQ